MKKVKIFLASSSELEEERKEIALLLYRESKSLIDRDIFLDLVVWEDLLHSFRGERIQNYFNEEMLKCDIVIALFHKKVGQFTCEEFELAYKNLREGRMPYYLFVYFKGGHISIEEIDVENIKKIKYLKETIKRYGQIYIPFKSIEELTLSLKNQFGKIFPNIISSNILQEISTVKYSIMYSDLSPDSSYEQIQSLYEKLEGDALTGEPEKIQGFIFFVQNKYLPSMTHYSNIKKSVNYLNYQACWDRIFRKGGSLSKIETNAKTKASLNALQNFRHDMLFSSLAPSQSMAQFLEAYSKLKKAAFEGEEEDIKKFISFIKNQYFPFWNACIGRDNPRYKILWENEFAENGTLSQLEVKLRKR